MDEVFYEVEAGWFRQVDLDQLGDTYALVPVESDLKGLGFEKLGDFVCSALTGSINRIWTHLSERVQAAILVGLVDSKLVVYAVFFDSHFADGSTVTTTATPALKSRETNGAYRKVTTWTNSYNLFQEHRSYVDSLSGKHGTPEPIAETLLAVMKNMDKATVEQSSF